MDSDGDDPLQLVGCAPTVPHVCADVAVREKGEAACTSSTSWRDCSRTGPDPITRVRADMPRRAVTEGGR